MKHLKIASNECLALERVDDFVPSVAMEGIADTIRTKFKALKAKLSSKPKDAQEQTKKNAAAIAEFETLLKTAKTELSKSNKDVVRTIDLSKQLDKFGIKASNSREVIAGLKAKHAEMRKYLAEVDSVAKEARTAVKNSNESAKKLLSEKAKALQDNMKDTKKVENSGKIEFSRKDLISLMDVMIDFCELFKEANQGKNLLKTSEELLELQSMIPTLEARDGGFFDGLVWIVVTTIELIMWIIVTLVIWNISLLLFAVSPFTFMFTALVVTSMYALRDQDDPRTRERDRNRN